MNIYYFNDLGDYDVYNPTYFLDRKGAKENWATKYVIGVLKNNNKAREIYESCGGKISNYESNYAKLGVAYDEVFYTYDI